MPHKFGVRALPAPSDRMPADLWIELRSWMLANDPDAPPMLDWSTALAEPTDPEKLAGEIVWIILCAGKTAQAARCIERRVWDAIHAGSPVLSAFGHRMRAAAIETAWARRKDLYDEFASLKAASDEDLLAWCRAMPGVGAVTCFQLAKNLGRDLPKPDIWLCRLAGIPDRPGGRVQERFAGCRALCLPLAEATGDRIATVDSLLWLACNKGVLQVDAFGGPVSYRPGAIKARPIMAGLGFETIDPAVLAIS
jgi:hypothetical protein